MSRFTNPVPQFYLNNGDIASSGKLYFYETGTTTKKDTFSNFGQTIKNTNPVILSGEGRCPNVFGNGRYTVVFKSVDDIEQWSRDDVELSVELGQYADWSAILTYRVNDIVRGSDGEYYRSLVNTNTGNDPISSPSQWEELAFLTYWNTNVSYGIGDLVVLSGILYRALTANSAKDPRDNPSDWSPDTQPNFSPYNSAYTYSKDQAVFYSGAYYRSITNSNKGNQPDTSTANWERIAFIGKWNINQTYNTDDIVEYSGVLYRSSADGNTGNIPSSGPPWVELSISEQSTDFDIGSGSSAFGAGQNIKFRRVGGSVQLTSPAELTHTSGSSVLSDSIPLQYRPLNGSTANDHISFVQHIAGALDGSFIKVSITENGRLRVGYFDSSGAAITRTNTGSAISVSYVAYNG